MIVVYTGEGCQPCRMLKQWLDSHDLVYDERPVKDHMDEFLEHGFRSVPVLVSEKIKVNGFNPLIKERLEEALLNG